MKKLLVYYNFIIVSLLTFSGFLNAHTQAELLAAALFYPLLVYFALLVIPSRNKSMSLTKIQVLPPPNLPANTPAKTEPLKSSAVEVRPHPNAQFDLDRRTFLKIIGSAGVSVFIYALFSNRAEAAFFGSVPGPGVVGVKDSSGARIDPAVRHPTDGYRISELDDGTTYVYGGYIDKDGNWFISREEVATGAFRYARGSSNFSANWTNRSSLTYDYFHNVF